MNKYSSKLIGEIDTTINDVKALSYDILPAPMTTLSFSDSINWLVASMLDGQNTNETNVSGCEELPLEVLMNIYRISHIMSYQLNI